MLGDAEALTFLRRGAEAGVELELSKGGGGGGWVQGVDLDQVRRRRKVRGESSAEGWPKKPDEEEEGSRSRPRPSRIVLMAIREIGNEAYYQRRGYQSIGTGVLPVGTWGSKVECTSVFMEKEI